MENKWWNEKREEQQKILNQMSKEHNKLVNSKNNDFLNNLSSVLTLGKFNRKEFILKKIKELQEKRSSYFDDSSKELNDIRYLECIKEKYEKAKAELKTKNEQIKQLNNKLKDTIENKENFDKNLINDCSNLPVTSSKKHTTQYFNRLT